MKQSHAGSPGHIKHARPATRIKDRWKSGIIVLLVVGMVILAAAKTGPGIEEGSGGLGTNSMAHVAIVVRDIETTTKAYARLFGIDPPAIKMGQSPDYLGRPTAGKAKMAFLKLDNISLEFFEPVGGPSAWQDFLEDNGEGVHHFGFWITGLDELVEDFETRQMPVVQSGGGDWGRYRYVDTRKELGLMIELLEKN